MHLPTNEILLNILNAVNQNIVKGKTIQNNDLIDNPRDLSVERNNKGEWLNQINRMKRSTNPSGIRGYTQLEVIIQQ